MTYATLPSPWGVKRQRRAYSFEDAFHVPQDIVVPIAQHTAAAFDQPSGARLIPIGAIGVLATVDLNDKPMLLAIEIEHVGSERMLTAELESVEPPVAQLKP